MFFIVDFLEPLRWSWWLCHRAPDWFITLHKPSDVLFKPIRDYALHDYTCCCASFLNIDSSLRMAASICSSKQRNFWIFSLQGKYLLIIALLKERFEISQQSFNLWNHFLKYQDNWSVMCQQNITVTFISSLIGTIIW